MSLENDPMFTVAEAAAILRWAKKSVYRAISQGRIATVRIGRSVRIKASDLEAFVKENTQCKSES